MNCLKISVALVPPNPKELLMAYVYLLALVLELLVLAPLLLWTACALWAT